MSINYFNPRSGLSQKTTKFLNFILKNVKKEIARDHVKALPKRFYLHGHTKPFFQQTEKLELTHVTHSFW